METYSSPIIRAGRVIAHPPEHNRQQMIGKRTIMAEELKGQVGEHIPTVIPLMAKAMGMDVKTLFKTMEKGELDPMVALPKLAKLMSEMSAPALAAYMKSLPYFQGLTQENRQLWGQRFLESGGTEGLTRFWEVMKQITEDSLPFADDIGEVFGELSWRFSNFMLLPSELSRWVQGETDMRNFWQKYLGDFEIWQGKFDILWNKMEPVLSGLVTLGDTILDKYVSVFEKTSSFQLDFVDKSQANRQAADILRSRGGEYSLEEFEKLSAEIYDSLKSERESSGKSSTQTYLERLSQKIESQGVGRSSPGAEALNFLFGWGEYSQKSLLENNKEVSNQPQSIMFQDTSPLSGLIKLMENSQPIPDYGPFVTPNANQLTPEVKITISGKVTVDGELGTVIDDTNLSEKFNEQLEQILFGARSQFSVVHR